MSRTRRQLLRDALAMTAATLGPAAGPPRSQAKRPNFLFFLPDQHRADWLADEPTLPLPAPRLEALAKEGVSFERAFCASPLCAPSRAALATGLEYDRCAVATNEEDLPRSATTFYARLREAGYHVMAAGKVDLAKGSRDWGLDGKRHAREWGFSDMVHTCGKIDGALAYVGLTSSLDPSRIGEDPAVYPGPAEPYLSYLDSLDPPQGLVYVRDILRRVRGRRVALAYGDTSPSPLPDDAYLDNFIGRTGLELLAAAPSDRPWLLVLNFAGPHAPADITARMNRRYRGPERVIDEFPQPHAYRGPISPARHVAIRQNYAAMIENLDRWLGIYRDVLARRGELERTFILWSSDHGEMLGDHSQWDKQVPWQPSVRVPLVVAGPGLERGLRSHALVSLIDLGPTLLDLAGLAPPDGVDGRSFRDVLEGRSRRHRDFVLSGLRDWRMVFDGRFKLVRGTGPETTLSRAFTGPLLYDLEEDPFEDHDLAGQRPAQVERLQALLPPLPEKAP